jgi:hypothetical protein
MKKILVLTILIASISQSVFSATRSWDAGGDGLTWTDKDNWDCNCMPRDTDQVTILLGDVTIPSGATIHIDKLLSYDLLTINSGATLTVNKRARFVWVGKFKNNGILNIIDEDLSLEQHHQVTNNGIINFSGSANFLTLSSTSSPLSVFTNNGTITFTSTNESHLDISNATFTNSGSGTINFQIGTGILNLISGTFFNSGVIDIKGSIQNSGNYTNTGTLSIHNFPLQGINNGGTFLNGGSIDVHSPSLGALYSIQNSGNFNGGGSYELTSSNVIYNSGSFTFGGPLQINGDPEFGGVNNFGTITFNNPTVISSVTGKLNNSMTGVVNIAPCKKVKHYGLLQNMGIINNEGTYNLSYNNIGNLGSFNNNGIYLNKIVSIFFPPPIINNPSSNNGLTLHLIKGQQCAGIPITNLFTGSLTNITQVPSGIFIDAALSVSAGTLDLSSRTFTPNIACHLKDSLYLSFQIAGCSPIVEKIYFEFPIYTPTIYYEDSDEDGYGALANPLTVTCGPAPFGYSLLSSDCDDTNPDVHPGAVEVCSDKDYNCDGIASGVSPATTWYKDGDNDGYGNTLVSITNCNPVPGYVSNDDDCNDNDLTVSPAAPELCNNIDEDCDGLIDEDFTMSTLTFNGSVDGNWFNALNWTPAMVPSNCVDVVIPLGKSVVILDNSIPAIPAICRSMKIAPTASVSLNGSTTLYTTGGTSFGIFNEGTLTLSGDSYTNIQYINGNGLENLSTVNMIGNAGLFISSTSNSSIKNRASATFTMSNTNGIDMNDAQENAILNAGSFTRNGNFNANNIDGSVIKNSGTFTNTGDLFANSFQLPQWFIENEVGGIFTHNTDIIIAFPIPNSFYNVSDKGLLNHPGSTFNNYGTLRFFGHRITGGGEFINHAGSVIEGYHPSLGCP